MENNYRRIFLLLLCLGAIACTKAPPHTAFNLKERQRIEAELSEYAAARAEISVLSAYVKVKIAVGSHRELFDVALLAKPPNHLFLQILDDLGQERVRVVADGRQVLFYDARENNYQLLPQDEVALEEALHLPISVEALIDMLLMRVPAGTVESVTTTTQSNPWKVTHWVQRDRDRLGVASTAFPLVVKQANWPCYGQANCATAKYPDRNPGPRRTGLEPSPTLKGIPTAIPDLKTGVYAGFHIMLYEAQDGRGDWKYRVAYRDGLLEWNFRRPKLSLTMNVQDADTRHKIDDRRFDITPPEGAVPSGKFH